MIFYTHKDIYKTLKESGGEKKRKSLEVSFKIILVNNSNLTSLQAVYFLHLWVYR